MFFKAVRAPRMRLTVPPPTAKVRIASRRKISVKNLISSLSASFDTGAAPYLCYNSVIILDLTSTRHFHKAKIAGYTSSSSRNEVKIPPIIGAAMRFITSAPVP